MSRSSVALPARLALCEPPASSSSEATRPLERDGRLRELFDSHYELVWRSLRRFGVAPGSIDDATQEVFMVSNRRLADIRPGSERAFLIGTAVRVAAEARRSLARKREAGADGLDELAADAPDAAELLDRERARAALDQVLGQMGPDLRAVFVLYELEGLTMAEIASAVELPLGTVASRLRRAREEFESRVQRMRARQRGVQ